MSSSAIDYQLTHSSISKLIMQYSGPAIVATVAVSLYNIVDSIFIGRDVGAMALAAMAIALPLMNLVIAFVLLVDSGGAAVTSILLGKKEHDKAVVTLNNVILLCLVHSVVFGGGMLLFLDPLLRLFGATDATIGYAIRYMRIILFATPISYVFLGLNNLMRASGYPKKAMISALFSVVANLALCPIFVSVLHWGMEGAALATVLGQTAALVWCVAHFVRKDVMVSFDPKANWMDRKITFKVYSIGLSPFILNVCACIVVVFLNHSLLDYGHSNGNYDIGAYGILNRVTMVFIMIVTGVTMGMQPIIGYNFGAGNWARVVKTLHVGIWLGVGITVIGWALTELCPDVISRLFTTDPDMIAVARKGFRIYFICYPVVGAEIVIQNFFQYIAKPAYSIFLSTTRQLLFLLPLLIVLPRFYGVPGVWASMAGSDLLAFLLAAVTLVVTMRKLDKQYATKPGGNQ